MKINVFLASHDTSYHILQCVKYLYSKYMPYAIVTILGYSIPNNIEFNDSFKFVSIGISNERKSMKEWSKNIANYMKTITDDILLFSVDDILIIDHADDSMLFECFNYMKKYNTISNIQLGSSSTHNIKLIHKKKDYNIYKCTSYQSSLQLHMWRRTELIRIFDNNFDTYDVEIKGSKMNCNAELFLLTKNKGHKSRVVPTQAHSALSESRNPGRICIVGIKDEDVRYLVEKNILNKDVLNYSNIKNINIPYIHGIDFSMSKINGKIPKNYYNGIFNLYHTIYKN